MIPNKLTIEGLYSYQTRQVIDFEHLNSGGLFGIFGAVGSGKSSILEAIGFAIYGETERMNSKDRRFYNMMNLKSNRFFVDFEFTNLENRKFRATRDYRRNSKNFDDVKVHSTAYYEWKDESWLPVENPKPQEITGLSYANFKRTIIIPQGQFREFLELGATERTAMMKEIFGLQKFDLAEKVAALSNQNKASLDSLNGQLTAYEYASQEEIDTKTGKLSVENKGLDGIKTQLSDLNERFSKLKTSKADHEQLQIKKDELQNLEKSRQEILDLEQSTELFDKIYRAFSNLVQNKSTLEKELSAKSKDLQTARQILDKTNFKISENEKKTAIIAPKFSEIEKTAQKADDLSQIVGILNLDNQIETADTRKSNGEIVIKKSKDEAEEIKISINELSKTLDQKKQQVINPVLLTSISNWYTEQKFLSEKSAAQREKIFKIEGSILEIQNYFAAQGVSPESFPEILLNEEENLAAETEKIRQKREKFLLQQELARYAHSLHDGEACPLCGSEIHPNIVEFTDVSEDLQTLEQELSKLKSAENLLQTKKSDFEKRLEKLQTLNQEKISEQQVLDEINSQISDHGENFIWENFEKENRKDFDAKIKHQTELQQLIKNLDSKIADARIALQAKQDQIEKYNAALQSILAEQSGLSGERNSAVRGLKILQVEDFQQDQLEEIERSEKILRDEIAQTTSEFENLSAEKIALDQQQIKENAEAANLQNRVTELSTQISHIAEKISQNLVNHNIDNETELNEILAQDINVDENRSRISGFKTKFESLKIAVSDLETKLSAAPFSRQEFDETLEQIEKTQLEFDKLNRTVITLNAEIIKLKSDYNLKTNLLEEKEKLTKRSDDLLVLSKLFKAAGFVQYVSSVYLRQLADHANVRFHRMTRNQLSLSLNSNNEFEIIDYLNDGRSRSVKTLSGGQAFQVSLSLALALAESVQSHAKSDKNFFFIDEGFGTQDAESVDIVFETLSNLQKENRIVGIISHVDALQERIPRSLIVTKDEGSGSVASVL